MRLSDFHGLEKYVVYNAVGTLNLETVIRL